ncbi:MAG: NAD+ synthase [Pyrobaculum sp.]
MNWKTVVEAIDYDKAQEIITSFIRQYVEETGVRGVVAGVSGGVDSTVAAALAAKALGPERVLGLFMPSVYTPPEDWRDVQEVSSALGIRLKTVEITPIVESFAKTIPDFSPEDKMARGNLMARVRMSILYYYANRDNLLVLGTSDRSEILLGYFTKYGDGGVDILPLAPLYKVQVREMAMRLGFGNVVQKPSSPRFWSGHTAEGELGASYEEIDPVLFALFDKRLTVEETRKIFGEIVDMVVRRVEKNSHKRGPPPSPDLSGARRDRALIVSHQADNNAASGGSLGG